MEIGDRGKVFEEHVKKGAVALLVLLVPRAHAIIGGVEAQDKVHEHGFPCQSSGSVSSLVLKLGTPSRIPPVADGGAKSVSEKYTAVVEIVMHVLK
jgi:hypothetical protein